MLAVNMTLRAVTIRKRMVTLTIPKLAQTMNAEQMIGKDELMILTSRRKLTL
jgi:hypothetical protein